MTVFAKKGFNNAPEGNVTLWQHTKDVWDASRALFGETEPTRLCRQWFRFFKVPIEHFETFRRRLDLAALWHDTGKATCSFQNMLLEGEAQLVRHEYLSYHLFCQVVKQLGLSKDDQVAIRFAILGHHLKAGTNYLFGNGIRLGLDQSNLPIRVFAEDGGLQQICRETEMLCTLDPGSLTLAPVLEGGKATSPGLWRNHLDTGREWLDDRPGPSAQFRALALALVASDSAGSGLRRTGQSVVEWIRQRFPEDPLTPKQLNETIIKGRTGDIEAITGKPFQPNDLQLTAQRLGSRAVLVSPCGSGKTLAAWLWAETQLQAGTATRVLFLYPTRNTATEGFRDYVSWGKEDASLLSGTSDYDLEGMAFQGHDHPSDDDKPKDPRNQTDYRPEAALYSLGYWNKRYVSATVDSFLSFSANNYGADCLLPLLCDSLVVVDEVHSFDPQMFNHLTRFLDECEVPVLMMTATLPRRMREALESRGAAVVEAPDPKGDTTRPRYNVSFAHEGDSIEQAVREWVADGEEKRLLAVCNIVSRCQQLGESLRPLLEQHDDLEIIVYHSRFRLEDRKRIHEDVIKKFRESPKRLVLLSTQVCQMSLDLDADSLFTEIAPLADIIQRMGRANRKGCRPVGHVKIFHVEKEKPYSRDSLDEARLRLSELPDPSSVSQAQLGELMASLLGDDLQDPELVPLFSNTLPGLESREYRLADDYTVDAVLPSELDRYIELRKARDPSAAGLVVPVPFYRTQRPSRRDAPRFLRVAKDNNYDSFLGFLERTPVCEQA